MGVVDFVPFKVHVITADSYVIGNLLLPRLQGPQGDKTPRFLDVLNNPATYLKNPGEVGSTTTIILVDGTRHSFHGAPARKFHRLYLRLGTILLGSDEAAPGSTGSRPAAFGQGEPSELEMVLRGGLRVQGTVRGGSKSALYPRADMPFIAATGVRYTSPLSPGQELELPFAAINNSAIESVIVMADDQLR